jgi:hypothetical protein
LQPSSLKASGFLELGGLGSKLAHDPAQPLSTRVERLAGRMTEMEGESRSLRPAGQRTKGANASAQGIFGRVLGIEPSIAYRTASAERSTPSLLSSCFAFSE